MKIKSFKLNVPSPKKRGYCPPPTRTHKDKRNDYNRQAFKRGEAYEF